MTQDDTRGDKPDDEQRERTSGGRVDDGDVSAVERDLAERREPYARATVVRRETPASANVGDRAVVTKDGDLYGWVGGAACAQSTVREQALEAIADGEPRLLGIAPDPESVERAGLEAFPMTCHSDGVLEVFVEPVVPTTELVVVGDSAVARSLARFAGNLTLDVTLVVEDASLQRDVPASTRVLETVDHEAVADAVADRPLVVVASMGEYDARGIAAGVLADAPYVGLVASSARADEEIELAAALADADPADVRAAVTNPAGVDVDAHTPAEIAASVVAEVVDARSRKRSESGGGREDVAAEAESVTEARSGSEAGAGSEAGTEEPESETGEAVDPVCGMTVDPASLPPTVEYGDETYSFCCQGCADSFATDPGEYLDGAEVNP
ncbi:MAG: XdhC family protein [Halobacterium sp.]